MPSPSTTITPREGALIAALTRIMLEVIPREGKKFSGDSWLPDHLVDAGLEALAEAGVTFDKNGTATHIHWSTSLAMQEVLA